METIAAPGLHRTAKGPPLRYPWDSMAVGDVHLIPTDAGVKLESVQRAVSRRNVEAESRGQPERFVVKAFLVELPDGRRAWQVCRVVDWGGRPAPRSRAPEPHEEV